MVDKRLYIEKLAPIDVYVTANVAVYRQFSLWQGLKRQYTFIPTRPIGYVIITEHGETTDYKPLKGYTLIRPAGLELSWDTDKLITFRTLLMADALQREMYTCKALWQIVDDAYHP